MAHGPDAVDTALERPPPAGIAVAYSGGMDSTVLLHALARSPVVRLRGLRALHVDHGLHPDSGAWAAHCGAVGAALDVPVDVLTARVGIRWAGPEAAARQARWRALSDALHPGEIVATAHHRDDQAETILLRLMRGAGPAGLAAMKALAPTAHGVIVWRPFLQVGRQDLMAWADRHHLTWIEDPSNDDTAFDRNHLRHVVLPALRHRWPDAAAALGQAAARQADAHDLEQAVARAVLERAQTGNTAVLSIEPLCASSRPERWAALRLWLADRGARDIGAARLARIDRELLDAAIDADPRIDLGVLVLRRHRDHLHAVRAGADATVRYRTSWNGLAPLMLPGNVGVLRIEPAPDEPLLLIVGSRDGGERLRLHPTGPRRKLKHLLQEAGVPGWHRQRWPVIRLDDEVVAFADRIVGHALRSRLDRLRCSLRFTAH